MDRSKKARLESAGFRVGDTTEFLGLTDEEKAFVETKVALAELLKEVRLRQGSTQAQLAKRLKSSQSRVAKMEAADPSVSLDLLMRALFTIGVSNKEVGRALTRAA